MKSRRGLLSASGASHTCLRPLVCVLRGWMHLCVLQGAGAEYLSCVLGQTPGHIAQAVVGRGVALSDGVGHGQSTASVDLSPSCAEPAPAPRAVGIGLCSQSRWDPAPWAVENAPRLGGEGEDLPCPPREEDRVDVNSYHGWRARGLLGRELPPGRYRLGAF